LFADATAQEEVQVDKGTTSRQEAAASDKLEAAISTLKITGIALWTDIYDSPSSMAARAEAPTLELNSRIRVSVTPSSQQAGDTKTYEGNLLDLSEETLTLKRPSKKSPLELQRQDVTEFEMRLQASRKGRGALIGLAAGAGLGVIMGYASGDDPPPSGWISLSPTFTAEQKAVLLATLLGVTGALVGALVSPGSCWVSIPPDQIRIGYDHRGAGGPVVCVTLRF